MESHRLRGVTLLPFYEGLRYVCSLSLELFPCTSVHFHGENTNRAVRSVLRVPVNFPLEWLFGFVP